MAEDATWPGAREPEASKAEGKSLRAHHLSSLFFLMRGGPETQVLLPMIRCPDCGYPNFFRPVHDVEPGHGGPGGPLWRVHGTPLG